MLEFLAPVEHFGLRFDRGSILFEFDALREPERTQFPQIGAWLRAKGIEFNEVPTPQMLWRGKLWPDLFIANQLDALCDTDYGNPLYDIKMPEKALWPASLTLQDVSISQQGAKFHDEFIEPMARKIAGRSSSEIAAKFHRAIWVPIFWPTTLRARQSIRTPFFYPSAGYAGRLTELLPVQVGGIKRSDAIPEYASVALSIAYVVAEPREIFSVCFVVDESPIYRITDMDVCAGIEAPLHRLIVEYRGECHVHDEMARLGFVDRIEQIAYGSARLQLPTLANVAAGWTPRPHINAQILEIINGQK